MKKGEILEGVIERIDFPNKGIIIMENEQTVVVKNGIAGQKVSFRVKKVRKGKGEGDILDVLEPSPTELAQPSCMHFGECGGCTYQNISYEEQLKMKEQQIFKLMKEVISGGENRLNQIWEEIKGSPQQFAYRNKMEYSFGDLYIEGPLTLGMHKRGSFYDIVPVTQCQIVHPDFNAILDYTMTFFAAREYQFFHKIRHTGYLRHLLVRRASKTQEVLINLITTTEIGNEERVMLEEYTAGLLKLTLVGTIKGILHTKNDSLADVVKDEGMEILYGQDYITEELLGLQFKISAFSFFQTNSLGAEVLYETARSYVGDIGSKAQVVFDLYSGTGTIGQILSPVAKQVIGVEIVPEAVEAAKKNAQINQLENCKFLVGDVLKVIDEIEEKPDFIILDPPRDGIHPKALDKIIDYGVERMIYISCKPTSLVRDLVVLQARGYQVERMCCVDMFPGTVHVETVILMTRCGKNDK
jgi:23S rRNA (uracil1939-C5)-methyltransferase